jgi:hypothetical protein
MQTLYAKFDAALPFCINRKYLLSQILFELTLAPTIFSKI